MMFMQTFACAVCLAICLSQIAYGPLTFGSDQKSVVPGLNSSFTPRLLLAMPSATTLPKACSASCMRPSFQLAR